MAQPPPSYVSPGPDVPIKVDEDGPLGIRVQLEKAQLENERLALEIADLRTLGQERAGLNSPAFGLDSAGCLALTGVRCHRWETGLRLSMPSRRTTLQLTSPLVSTTPQCLPNLICARLGCVRCCASGIVGVPNSRSAWQKCFNHDTSST
jgi:hypothetical protein